jgi:chaperonin GroEL (HSP60 family)
MQNVTAILQVRNIIGSTLGPQGKDVLIFNNVGESVVSNDGATILKNLNVNNVIIKNLIDSATTQEKTVGDGTSTLTILSGELSKKGLLLREDEFLDPVITAKGYQLALEKSKELLTKFSVKVDLSNQEELKKFVKTTLTGKNTEGFDNIYNICIEAIKTTNGDTTKINLMKIANGNVDNSRLVKGIVLDLSAQAPKPEYKAPKVLLLDQEIGNVNPAVNMQYNVTSADMLDKVRAIDEDRAKEFYDKIKELGVEVVICQRDINDFAFDLFSQNGILAVRNADKDNMELLSKALNARIVKNIKLAKNSDLGVADFVKVERLTDDDDFVVIESSASNVVSVLVCGTNKSTIEEYERGIEDALGVLKTIFKHNSYVYGAGNIEVKLAQGLRDYAKTIENGKYQLAIEKYAESLEVIPKLLADSCGLDRLIALGKLRLNPELGIDVENSELRNMPNVIEPTNVKLQALVGATELACNVLRIGYNLQGRVE